MTYDWLGRYFASPYPPLGPCLEEALLLRARRNKRHSPIQGAHEEPVELKEGAKAHNVTLVGLSNVPKKPGGGWGLEGRCRDAIEDRG